MVISLLKLINLLTHVIGSVLLLVITIFTHIARRRRLCYDCLNDKKKNLPRLDKMTTLITAQDCDVLGIVING